MRSVCRRCHGSPYWNLTEEWTWLRRVVCSATRLVEESQLSIAWQVLHHGAAILTIYNANFNTPVLHVMCTWSWAEHLAAALGMKLQRAFSRMENIWRSVRDLKWSREICCSVLSCPRASPCLLLLSEPVQPGNLTALFSVWGWCTSWIPDGQAVPVALGTVVEWQKSTVARNGNLSLTQEAAGTCSKKVSTAWEKEEESREWARVSTSHLPYWERELLGFCRSGKGEE